MSVIGPKSISLMVDSAQQRIEAVEFYSKLGFRVLMEDADETKLVLFNDVEFEIRLARDPQTLTFTTFGGSEHMVDPMGNSVQLLSIPVPRPVPVVEAKRADTVTSGPSNETNGIVRRLGILTSGGDSCGMNPAVRAITRVALQKGCIPFAIYEGYQGLVDGGEKIKELKWSDVRSFLSQGGTGIGTARCQAFRNRPGRLLACYNMIKNGIDALVVIGGDGSLTGADLFRQEWAGLVEELIAYINLIRAGKVTAEESNHLKSDLTIVGLVGSIDNDMSSTDITIGAVTALHRICESVDALVSTAQSHQRAFVIEVMGRHCGWLALMAAIAVGADTVFLPERPPPMNQQLYGNDWKQEMCDIIKHNRNNGNRKSLVIVCEGAIDRDLNPIKVETVKEVLEKRLQLDTRVTNLGHVQRGGHTCAFDRYLGTVQGYEAVNQVLKANSTTPSPMIGMSNNEITVVPLMDAVNLTKQVEVAISKKDFSKAMELRDPQFNSAYKSYLESSLSFASVIPKGGISERNVGVSELRIGVIHVGAPAGGMNAATRIIARLCRSRGYTPVAIKNGFEGLVNNEFEEMTWNSVRGWQTIGGSRLGSNRTHPSVTVGMNSVQVPHGVDSVPVGQIAYYLQKNNIHGLICIGGFEAFTSMICLTEMRAMYPAFCIPLIHMPATISNNCPGTDFSIGSDTALNVIVNACDSLKLSANASKSRVFVVEVHGGNCGYLSLVGGLCIGSTASYVPEVPLSLQAIQSDIKHLLRRFQDDHRTRIASAGRVILRAENTRPEIYSTSVITGILKAEGQGLFDSREAVLGHLQQGDEPSPLDRIRATRMAVRSVDFIEDVIELNAGKSLIHPSFTKDIDHSVTIGISGADLVSTPLHVAMKQADLKRRTSTNTWWRQYEELHRILDKREFTADEV